MGRLAEVRETPAGGATTTRPYLWCGLEICEQRSNSGSTVLRRYYDEGFVDVSTGITYTYTRDHLGSVRELLNAAGQVVSRFDYDPWGQRSWVSGTVDSSFGYAGYFRHATSGLDLTLFRAYDPELGRWLSRDPILEAGGLNVYGYVGNSGVNGVDPFGLGGDPTGTPGWCPTERFRDGIVKQWRLYGEDGRAVKDVDFGHEEHGHGTPHVHDWVWDGDDEERMGARAPSPGEVLPVESALSWPGNEVIYDSRDYATAAAVIVATAGMVGAAILCPECILVAAPIALVGAN